MAENCLIIGGFCRTESLREPVFPLGKERFLDLPNYKQEAPHKLDSLLNALNLFFLCHSQTLQNTTIASL